MWAGAGRLECVKDDIILLGLQPEWAIFRDPEIYEGTYIISRLLRNKS